MQGATNESEDIRLGIKKCRYFLLIILDENLRKVFFFEISQTARWYTDTAFRTKASVPA